MITKFKPYALDLLAILKYHFFRVQQYPAHIDPITPKIPCQEEWNVGIHLHVHYVNLLDELCDFIKNIPIPYTIYVTVTEDRSEFVSQVLSKNRLDNVSQIIPCENKGKDIAPWLQLLSNVQKDHEIWCHVHTKRSPHLTYRGHLWRRFLLSNLLGRSEYISKLLGVFERDSRVGLIFPPPFSVVYNQDNLSWVHPPSQVKKCLGSLLKSIPSRPEEFPMGTMLWYRPEALNDLFVQFSSEDFQISKESEWEIIERALPLIAKSHGYTSVCVSYEKKSS
jgi:lipopolysaccharide biosynthesis protein